MAKALTPTAVVEIHRLREELDDWGEPKYSGAYIAEQLGVSEATIWRVLKKRAAYATNKKSNGQDIARFDAMVRDTLGAAEQERPDLDAAAIASQAKLLASMERKAAALPMSSEAKARLATFTNPLEE